MDRALTAELRKANTATPAGGGAPDRGHTRAAPASPQGEGGQPLRSTPRRMLLIDDEPMILATLAMLLSKQYDVVTASSGSEARDMLQSDRGFDVLLCDLMMADVSGMDLHRSVLALDPQLARRMVFMTGGAYTEAAERFLLEVPNPRVVKPFELSDLQSALHEVLRGATPAVE